MPQFLVAGVLAAAAHLAGCRGSTAGTGVARPDSQEPVVFRPDGKATKAFWQHWGDGKAELSGYRVETSRYGRPRSAQVVLIYVTEPMDSRTWIKDDQGHAAVSHRVEVLKLNHVLKFQTGIYPYSVMTSVFSPVAMMVDRERFAPTKISFTAQEWCGHVFSKLMPTARGFRHEIRSYFASEGEAEEAVATAAGTLYEDALLIQLRELDGPFAGGKNWSGYIVPSAWRVRKAHRPLRSARATIRRSNVTRAGTGAVTRFVVEHGDYKRIYEVERAAPRRVVAWSDSRGEQAVLLKTARLSYWRLNQMGDEKYLEELGLTHCGLASCP